MLMEYAAGGTLADDICRQRRIGTGYDSTVVISWTAQLAMAVSYMHARSVLHRDLSSGVCLASHIAQPRTWTSSVGLLCTQTPPTSPSYAHPTSLCIARRKAAQSRPSHSRHWVHLLHFRLSKFQQILSMTNLPDQLCTHSVTHVPVSCKVRLSHSDRRAMHVHVFFLWQVRLTHFIAANVFLSRERAIKVGDLGLSKKLSSQGEPQL